MTSFSYVILDLLKSELAKKAWLRIKRISTPGQIFILVVDDVHVYVFDLTTAKSLSAVLGIVIWLYERLRI